MSAFVFSQKLIEQRKNSLILFQERTEKIIKDQNLKKMSELENRRELFEIKKEITQKNLEAKIKREQYYNSKLNEKLIYTDDRINKMNTLKEKLKMMRQTNLYESSFKRQIMNNTMHYMAVWNASDIDLIKSIINNYKNLSKSPTIEEQIRRSIIPIHRTSNLSLKTKNTIKGNKMNLDINSSQENKSLNNSLLSLNNTMKSKKEIHFDNAIPGNLLSKMKFNEKINSNRKYKSIKPKSNSYLLNKEIK